MKTPIQTPSFWLKRIALSLGISATLSVSALAGTTPLVKNGVDWGTNYYAAADGVLPGGSSFPTWSLSGAGTISLEDDLLVVSTTDTQSRRIYTTAGIDWSQGSMTVEFSLKVDSVHSVYGTTVLIGDGTNYVSVDIGLSSFRVGKVASGGTYDFTQLTTFRLVIENMDSENRTATVYINNSPEAVLTATGTSGFTSGTASTANYLQFGDPSTTPGGVGGVTRWESISWTPGAFVPIPEPSAALLMVTGLGLALAWRHRK